MALFLRCPYCRKVLPRGAWGDPTGRWGSPFVTCPQCGKDCVDATKIEPALKELTLPDLSVKHLIGVHFFPYGALAILALLASFRTKEGWVFWLFAAAFMGVYVYRVLRDSRDEAAVHARMKKLYAESEERLKDPQYVRGLISLNYDVPQKLREYAAQFPEKEEEEDS